jgi:hypothetical protein
VNLASGIGQESFGFRFYGSEGILTTSYSSLRLEKHPRDVEPGYTINTFAKKDQDAFLAEYRRKYPLRPPAVNADSEFRFAPRADAHQLHHEAFAKAIRGGGPSVEDGTFGFRAAAPALLCNQSTETGIAYGWDPIQMRKL